MEPIHYSVIGQAPKSTEPLQPTIDIIVDIDIDIDTGIDIDIIIDIDIDNDVGFDADANDDVDIDINIDMDIDIDIDNNLNNFKRANNVSFFRISILCVKFCASGDRRLKIGLACELTLAESYKWLKCRPCFQ